MGKCLRKTKPVPELPRMELAQSSLGVRTRARTKTLALQRLQKSEPVGTEPPARTASPTSSGSYLQLRSRRLAKPSIYGRDKHTRPAEESCVANPNPSEEKMKENNEEDIEASFGENVLEFEPRGRYTRESTPSSFVRDPESIPTPCSSTRTNRAATSMLGNLRMENSRQSLNPPPQEIDGFFSGAEENQQRQFIEKYNFDPMTDRPLPGRFEWEKVNL